MNNRPRRSSKTIALHQMFGESETEPESTDSEVSDVEQEDTDRHPDLDTDDEGEGRHLRSLVTNVPQDDFETAPLLTPLEYFHLFLNQDMIDHLTLETNRYSVELTGQSIDCKSSEMKKFIGITIQMGICKMPTYRMYWTPLYRHEPVSGALGLNRFETLKRYFHVNDNANRLNDDDPVFKVRPLLNHVLENCRKIQPESRQCVDEQMVK